MSSSLRKLKRRPRPATQAPILPNAYDPKTLRLVDIENIVLDAGEHLAAVTFLVPVGEGEAMAEFELSFDVEEHPALSMAATALAKALLDLVKLPQPEESPCATCTGACCGREAGSVRVTQADIARMEAADVACSETVQHYSAGEVFSGYVGEFVQVPYSGPDAKEGELCCPHLTRAGCSIYAHRPTVCRDYSAWTCDLHVEDPEKVRLRVVAE